MSTITPETNDAPKGADILPIKPDYHQWKGLNVKEENIPDSLRDIPQWVMWKAKPKKDGGFTKPPRTMQGESASSTDPATWTDYDSAVSAYEKDQKRSEGRRRFDGIGFVITEGCDVVGIDLDHMRDATTGLIKTEYKEELDKLDTYQEISPSGSGVRVIGSGKLPFKSFTGKELEMYDNGRFLTITGHVLKAKPLEPISDEMLTSLKDRFIPRETPVQAADALSTIAAAIDTTKRDTPPLSVIMAALEKVNPDQDYDTWMRVGMALKDCGSPMGFELYLAWSRGDMHGGSAEYEGEQDVRKEWDSFKSKGVGIGTLLYMAGMKEKVKVFSKPQPIGLNALQEEPPPPEFIVSEILPKSVFELAGPGGVAKTTFAMYVMVHIVTGRPLMGREIEHSGACVLVSAEDDDDLMRNRLHRICKALALTKEEQRMVADRLHVHDVSGEMVRLVEADERSNLEITQHVDDFINAYQGVDVKLTVIDPAVFFGAGERFANDGASTLMQAGRRLVKGMDSAVCFIHHMSMAATTSKNTTSHAGRSAAAFGDNSRGVWVMHRYEGKKNEPKRPKSVSLLDVKEKRVSYISIPKISWGPEPEGEFWFIRSPDDGFKFTTLAPEEVEHVVVAEETQDAIQMEDLRVCTAVWNIVRDANAEGNKVTSIDSAVALAKGYAVNYEGGIPSRQNIRDGVHLCLHYKFISEEPLPKNECKGSRKNHYLKGNKPFIGKNGIRKTKEET